MTLRILHVLDHSIPLQSGYSFRTLAILREQRRLGWQTFHLTSGKHAAGFSTEEDVDGWHFYRTPSRTRARPRLPGAAEVELMLDLEGRLRAVIDELRPDLLHVHSPVLNALPALWVRRRAQVPVIYEVRASWEDAAVDHGTTTEGSVRYRLSRAIESFALRRADQVVTICEGLRGDIRARGIAEERITVVPNAVDTAELHFGVPPDASLQAQLGLSGCTVIGFAGSFYRYEGLHLLVQAFARMRQRDALLRLLLVGGGPQESALREQVTAAGIADSVVFTGRVPNSGVQRYYALIDLLAYPRLPCRLTELVTPLKPLEAMAQGRVLVASDVGGHRELIRDGQTGWLCPAGDASALESALETALSRREHWPALRERARRYVERERTWSASVARYADVYRCALNARRQLQPVGG
jgi:glycogen(starch) synthase